MFNIMMDDDMENEILCELFNVHLNTVTKYIQATSTTFVNTMLPGPGESYKTLFLRPGPFMAMMLCLIVFSITVQRRNNWYHHVLLSWQRSLKLPSVSENTLKNLVAATINSDNITYDLQEGIVGVYALQGRRGAMEDRFSVQQKVNVGGKKEMSFFGVYDGHGGQFVAEYTRQNLFSNIIDKVRQLRINTSITPEGETKSLNIKSSSNACSSTLNESNKVVPQDISQCGEKTPTEKIDSSINADKSIEVNKFNTKITLTECKETKSDETEVCEISSEIYLAKEDPYSSKTVKRNSFSRTNSSKELEKKVVEVPNAIYTDSNSNINFTRLLTDQIMEIDSKIIKFCKSKTDFSGTTAVMAVLEGEMLIIGNVGDSRAVMGDINGAAIQLSFDHKPNQLKEHRRIKDAGGFIAFTGVWRVAGILATSRALGDFPLKDPVKLITAEPDVLTFSIRDHKAHFVILATDGLWDVMTNEEAVSFVKEHIHEKDFGARSLSMHAYHKGSQDNITVAIINLEKLKI